MKPLLQQVDGCGRLWRDHRAEASPSGFVHNPVLPDVDRVGHLGAIEEPKNIAGMSR